jgi:hypothetical protein
MPKRLVKYALSRLDVLDTDALDLENLDISWGKSSTLEFRDVGLRLKVDRHARRALEQVLMAGILETRKSAQATSNIRGYKSPRATPPSYHTCRRI